MSVERVLNIQQIKNIKKLRNLKTKEGKQKYSQKKLGIMYYVDQKTICNYLKGDNL
jgi:hypothetical protein